MSHYLEVPFLRTDKLTKRFLQVVANDSISLDLFPGEIHCLLGENGAGKSTLAECLYGAQKPDGGRVIMEGTEVEFHSPHDAIDHGIGLVHQHFVLVPALTVVENVVVGTISDGIAFEFDKAEQAIRSVCETYGIEIDLRAKVWQLSVGEQQWVEILKVLYLGVKLLILDEPTASLTLQETERLFAILEKMKKDGLSIVLITHKLREVMQIADKVSVLRKGRLISTVLKSEVTEKDLARMMVGRDVVLRVRKDRVERGDVLMEVKGLRTLSDKDQETVRGIDLALHRSEILGIAGVSGNGQRELFETIVGVRKATDGQVFLDGDDITGMSPREIMRRGVAHIPEDRIHEGLMMEFSVMENLILGFQRNAPYRQGFFLNQREIEDFAHDSISRFEISTPSIEQPTKFLSGGNLQRIILARELSTQPKCIIASQPTRGLDIAACEYVYQLLLEQRRNGVGILLFSEDLQELLSLSDRIGVMYGGQILDIFDEGEATLERVGLLMGGVQE